MEPLNRFDEDDAGNLKVKPVRFRLVLFFA